MRYIKYRFNDGTSYIAKAGKDGVDEECIKEIHRVEKSLEKHIKKQNDSNFKFVSFQEEFMEDIQSEYNVELVIEDLSETQMLRAVIDSLPETDKFLINQIFFKGLSITHVAGILHVSDASIHKKLKRIYKLIANNW